MSFQFGVIHEDLFRELRTGCPDDLTRQHSKPGVRRSTSGIALSLLWFILEGCGGARPTPPNPPLKVVVAPIAITASLSRSTQLYSFQDEPSPERDAMLLQQLKAELQLNAQRSLTYHLGQQPGFVVVPFEEVRRVQVDFGPSIDPWSETQLRTLGHMLGADVVITGNVVAYGTVPWKYMLTGLATQNTVELAIVGAATAWNPAAIGIYVVTDVLLFDLPLWTGGVYLFGLAFRPVLLEVKALQLTPCDGDIWIEQEVAMKVPGKSLEAVPPEERGRKEVQLTVNLERAMQEIAETAGEEVRLQSCTGDRRPAQGSGFSLPSALGLNR